MSQLVHATADRNGSFFSVNQVARQTLTFDNQKSPIDNHQS
jgi:hypothetical protein